MLSAASALVCALAALNRTAATLPPIEILDTPPAYVSVGTEAFVRDGTIYVIGSSVVVRDAAARGGRCGDPFAVKKLASILVHEEYHLEHPGDERGAYHRQLIALQQLGISPGQGVYREVQLSMLRVLELQKRTRNKPDLVLAGR
jgi:hypothetical protein